MREVRVRGPFLICERNTLFCAPLRYFAHIARLDEAAGILDKNVKSDGRAHMRWILDSDGMMHDLTSEGILPPSLFQWLRLTRRRERYRISPPRQLRVSELLKRIEPLDDEFPEAPVVEFTRDYLGHLSPDTILDHAILKDYFGTKSFDE
jgi:hypothetical protein